MSKEESLNPSPEQSHNIIKELSNELSVQSKIGVITVLGGLAVESAGIAFSYMNTMTSKSNELISPNFITDLRLAGVIAFLGGASIIAERINSSTKHHRNNSNGGDKRT
ncbi:MAG: hypothetical protein WCG30_01915 [Candidatus Saccharibacteria bacterium]